MKRLSDVDKDAIKKLFVSGISTTVIAANRGVTPQAVSRALKRMGVVASEGGRAKRKEDRAKAYRDRREKRCLSLYGLTLSERNEIHEAHGYKPFLRFSEHRSNAQRRGIQFLFPFREWWQMWMESGRWSERGRKSGRHGYVMSRLGDVGPYSRSNVVITTQSANMFDYANNRLSSIQKGDRRV